MKYIQKNIKDNLAEFKAELEDLKNLLSMFFRHTDKYKGSYKFGIYESLEKRRIRETESTFNIEKDYENIGLKIVLRFSLDCNLEKMYFEKKYIEINGVKHTQRSLTPLFKEANFLLETINLKID